ncbi:EmrB/QacA family drug resistance transporter [Caballeronia ptereochthonis]|uniref:EmrB/QacA family drug resistance transporter n=1 Tax=Caballeronia ptereochthonis TaxID=1777144 RepID=A0A157ZIJ5_9BURK|nr:EmrB/QacA family drug resistance transporter [Caballeronia ptereochthonis]
MNPATQPAPLQGGKLVLATLAVALATFMNVLDSSIAKVAIPTIAGNLGVSVYEGGGRPADSIAKAGAPGSSIIIRMQKPG